MTSQQLAKLKLPDVPGVYIFHDVKGRPLYIGRATSLKDRTRSYFAADLIETRGPRIVDMITRAKTVKWQETDSVLEAIILESNLIKRYQPHYNVDERDDKSSQYVIITDELWPRVFLARVRDFDVEQKEGRLGYKVKEKFGPYPHGGLIKEALKILRKMFPLKDKKSFDARHDAFYRALGRSPQADDENARRRYHRTIENLALFFEGRKDLIRRRMERDMNAYAKELKFEEADQCKRIIYALDHINDMALIKREGERSLGSAGSSKPDFRIEAYDIAHLSGTNVVGAFTVSVNGEFAPAEYRKFKISRQTNDDIRGLTEIIDRRLNHSEWPYPDLIIVDGNVTHLAHAEGVLKARRITIPIVAVTKDERHKAARLIGDPSIIAAHEKDIVALNAEAHRFVIRYHRQKRKL
ncbi:MAG: GIY-YIG nuclease family protein [Candidatus Pacebacteria bacterium]|nr:GIY-YIG nuclease family protein [Candidatus Paceibacterota bacterium]